MLFCWLIPSLKNTIELAIFRPDASLEINNHHHYMRRLPISCRYFRNGLSPTSFLINRSEYPTDRKEYYSNHGRASLANNQGHRGAMHLLYSFFLFPFPLNSLLQLLFPNRSSFTYRRFNCGSFAGWLKNQQRAANRHRNNGEGPRFFLSESALIQELLFFLPLYDDASQQKVEISWGPITPTKEKIRNKIGILEFTEITDTVLLNVIGAEARLNHGINFSRWNL